VLPEQQEGRTRVIIENVTPQVDDGAFPIKRIIGDTVIVEADVFTDGHDAIACALLYKKEGDSKWTEAPMEALVNDRWRGSFKLIIGADMIAAAGKHASPTEAGWHEIYAESVRAGGPDGIARAASAELAGLMQRNAERLFACTPSGREQEFSVLVDRERARFGAWYELFPRSTSPVPGRHGTFKDLEARLPYVAAMNFDVLYLPPIHPIGRSFRKGRNNSTTAGPDDPGSPWAIGSAEGGHKAVHPELGTLADFRHLVDCAAQHGLELALDIAFQCAPDHPL
jgi:starch synthase (maltosyl-transferring)